MAAYYNEVDAYAAGWLRNLIASGHIAPGDVDERSIADVGPGDLEGYEQCHFFAGIGGWPYALRLAGWPDDKPVWTGSCPCQPLSSAGQRKGHVDERHLWPAFYDLIAECRPATVFGEQVAGTLGREWLAGVRADLEDAGYAVGAADLCAAGVTAPHIRQRLFWVADSTKQGRGRQPEWTDQPHGRAAEKPRRLCRIGWLGDANQDGRGAAGGCFAQPQERDAQPHGGLGDAGTPGLPASEPETLRRERRGSEGRAASEPSPSRDFWSRSEWLPCLDGKARRVEPGIFPLVDGVSARVGKLRGAGNSIVPQVAATFVAAFSEVA